MNTIPRFAFIVLLMIGIVGCSSSKGTAQLEKSAVNVDGVIFEITDAAISSNCLSLTFSVRGYTPSTDGFPRRGFMPIKDIEIQSSISGLLDDLVPLWGGGGGGGWGAGWGAEAGGRVWMEQEMHYALKAPIAEDTLVPLDITVVLDDDFGMSEAFEFYVTVSAGPGGGLCPYPGSE
jgi:hypothetical protein